MFRRLPLLLLCGLLAREAAAADWPSHKKLSADVRRFWKKEKPQQAVDYIKQMSGCQPVAPDEVPPRGGKPAKGKACAVEADLYFEHGFRYDVLRSCKVFYVNGALWTIQPGNSDRAWKEGGVPPPDPQEAVRIIGNFIQQSTGEAAEKIELVEMGTPRPDGNFYRLTVVFNLVLKNKQSRSLEKFPFFLQSEGEGWAADPSINQLTPTQ